MDVVTSVTVYSPPAHCPKCMATKIYLKKNGIAFTEEIMSDEDISKFKADGHTSSPVVIVDLGDGATWTFSDYRHDDLTRLKKLSLGERVNAA